MNIIEAIKSGKRYKRKAYREWYSPASSVNLRTEDILADDWEVEENKVTITEAQFDAAHRATMNKIEPGATKPTMEGNRLFNYYTHVYVQDYIEKLKKELGL